MLLLVAPVFPARPAVRVAAKREQNFMLVFHLSFVVALLYLFPVQPGNADIAQRVCGVLPVVDPGRSLGSLLVMGSRVIGRFGLGAILVALGRRRSAWALPQARSVLAIGWTMTPDFETVASALPTASMKVGVVTSFALIVLFCATNVVLRGSMLRRVELIARGRITQSDAGAQWSFSRIGGARGRRRTRCAAGCVPAHRAFDRGGSRRAELGRARGC